MALGPAQVELKKTSSHYYALINRECGPGPNSRLIRALLYTHTSKTTKSQCFPLLLWTEIQPVHTPVRTHACGPALRQSNFSILFVFCLVYNKYQYCPNTSSSLKHSLSLQIHNKNRYPKKYSLPFLKKSAVIQTYPELPKSDFLINFT